MATGFYPVIDGKTRKAKANYAVVGGVTKKIARMYAVVDGKTRLIWSPGGIDYLFRGLIYPDNSSGKIAFKTFNGSSFNEATLVARSQSNGLLEKACISRNGMSMVISPTGGASTSTCPYYLYKYDATTGQYVYKTSYSVSSYFGRNGMYETYGRADSHECYITPNGKYFFAFIMVYNQDALPTTYSNTITRVTGDTSYGKDDGNLMLCIFDIENDSFSLIKTIILVRNSDGPIGIANNHRLGLNTVCSDDGIIHIDYEEEKWDSYESTSEWIGTWSKIIYFNPETIADDEFIVTHGNVSRTTSDQESVKISSRGHYHHTAEYDSNGSYYQLYYLNNGKETRIAHSTSLDGYITSVGGLFGKYGPSSLSMYEDDLKGVLYVNRENTISAYQMNEASLTYLGDFTHTGRFYEIYDISKSGLCFYDSDNTSKHNYISYSISQLSRSADGMITAASVINTIDTNGIGHRCNIFMLDKESM